MLNKQKVLFLLAVFVCLHIYAQDKHFVINYYSGNKVEATQTIPWNCRGVTDSRSQKWQLEVDSIIVDKKQGIVDYKIRYILLSQCASQVSVGVNFCFYCICRKSF